MTNNGPIIGVAGIIYHENKVLLGLRKGSKGSGTWGFPGGKVKKFETLESGLKREVREETSLMVYETEWTDFTEDFFHDREAHYITHFMRTHNFYGVPRVTEPEKCEEWKWFPRNKLPDKLFLPIENLLKKGYKI